MKTIQEQMTVMQHYANGGEVEIFSNDKWVDATGPVWNWNHCDYRIKEQKKTIIIEKWLCEYNRCNELKGSKRFFILEKAVPFEFGNGRKVKLLETYEVEI